MLVGLHLLYQIHIPREAHRIVLFGRMAWNVIEAFFATLECCLTSLKKTKVYFEEKICVINLCHTLMEQHVLDTNAGKQLS